MNSCQYHLEISGVHEKQNCIQLLVTKRECNRNTMLVTRGVCKQRSVSDSAACDVLQVLSSPEQTLTTFVAL